MMNTSGGVVIVGLVENPKKIVREDVLENMVTREERTFYDVNHDLTGNKSDLDSLKLHLLDSLKCEFNITEENFNGLIDFEKVWLREGERSIMIVKVNIQKAPNLFFSIKDRV